MNYFWNSSLCWYFSCFCAKVSSFTLAITWWRNTKQEGLRNEQNAGPKTFTQNPDTESRPKTQTHDLDSKPGPIAQTLGCNSNRKTWSTDVASWLRTWIKGPDQSFTKSIVLLLSIAWFLRLFSFCYSHIRKIFGYL